MLACAVVGRHPPHRPRNAKKPELLVFAAASLTNVLGELVDVHWEESFGVTVKLSFAASSVLARQIEAGGNADVFISADQEWMDYLQARNLIDEVLAPQPRRPTGWCSSRPPTASIELKIAPGFNLAGALGGGRLSTGDPDTVPGGPLRALGAHVAGRLGRGRRSPGARRQRAQRHDLRRARRGAARHRLHD